jgi:hypothetical protein
VNPKTGKVLGSEDE